MNHAGDAAEQIVRMTLQGTEIALRITGTAAKETALFLVAAFKKGDKDNLKLKGKARLVSMLKSGKPLEIMSIKERDLAKFCKGAKEYGIVYCVLRKTKSDPDGLCDVMVKADDAPKISRLVERFGFATVNKAKIESEVVADMGKAKSGEIPDAPDINDTEKLVDDLMGASEGKADKPNQKQKGPQEHPLTKGGQQEKSNQFVHTSETRKKPVKTSSSKPSVKEEIKDITAKRKQKETTEREEREEVSKPRNTQKTKHKQPRHNKSKSKKSKGR